MLGRNLLPSKVQKMSQRINAAKKTVAGRTVRRAMEMLIERTPGAPAYNAIKQSGRASKPRKQRSSPRSSASISSCVNKMMLAATNPFSMSAAGACIPDGNVAASVRAFAKTQVTVTIGTGGMGFLHYYACATNDGWSYAYTGAAFSGVTCKVVTATNIAVAGVAFGTLSTAVTSDNLTIGYAIGDERERFSTRLVAAGVTFRYTGKEINKSGQVYAYIHPAHNSSGSVTSSAGLDNSHNQDSLAQFPETFIVECSRSESFIPLLPAGEDELGYSNEGADNKHEVCYPWSNGGVVQPGGYTYVDQANVNVGHPILTVIFTGTAGETYVANIGQHQEIIGVGVNAYSRIAPESDPVGVRDLMGSMARFQLNRRREPGLDATREYKAAIGQVMRERSGRVSV